MAKFFYDNLAKNLPDAYKKNEESNNYKILKIEQEANGVSRSLLEGIEQILDIEKAEGKTLDLYGERFGQPRGQANDVQYRLMIKSKIARGLSSGNYSSVVDALAYTFNGDTNEILLRDTEVPLVMTLEGIPLASVYEAGFSISQAMKIAENLMPAIVKLESVMFEGTFQLGVGVVQCPVCGKTLVDTKVCDSCVDEFGNPQKGVISLSEESDYDEKAGLGETTDGTIGGELGWMGTGDTSTELPI